MGCWSSFYNTKISCHVLDRCDAQYQRVEVHIDRRADELFLMVEQVFCFSHIQKRDLNGRRSLRRRKSYKTLGALIVMHEATAMLDKHLAHLNHEVTHSRVT